MNINQNDSCGLTHTQTYMEQFFFSLLNKSANGNRIRSAPIEFAEYFPVSLEQFVGLAIDMNGNRYALNQINCAHSPTRFFSHRRNCAKKAQENFNYNSIEMITKSEEKNETTQTRTIGSNQRKLENFVPRAQTGTCKSERRWMDFPGKIIFAWKRLVWCQMSKFGNVRFFFYWEQSMHFALNCHQMLWNGRIYMKLLSVFSFPNWNRILRTHVLPFHTQIAISCHWKTHFSIVSSILRSMKFRLLYLLFFIFCSHLILHLSTA